MLGHLKANVIFPLVEKQQGRDILSKLKELQFDYLLPREQRNKRRQAQIYKLLKVSQSKVPYYRNLFKKISFDPELVLKDLRYLHELPFLTKEIVREQEDQLIHEDYAKQALHLRRTGGSTGASTKIYYNNEALDWTSAVHLFVLSFTGRKLHQSQYHFGNNPLQNVEFKEDLKRRFKHWATNRENISTLSLDDSSLSKIWKELRSKKPYVVQGHPSTMYALSKYIEKTKSFDEAAVMAFESTGETLDFKKVKSIQNNIGCKVFNRFGNAEFGVIAHSKDNPSELEVIDYICYPESVALGNGLDEIVLTTTTNFAMPLIRYRTGDIGKLSKTEEREYITDIRGRIHDLIEVNGKLFPTHFLQDTLDSLGGVDEFQIVQRSSAPYLAKIVPHENTNQEMIRERLSEIFGPGNIEISFTNFDGLILSGWRDKFRFFIKERNL